ncbi:MAG: hypothetical protein QOH71_2664 [Blastocatellia bacterium]|jgi:hypothetical protein|nr:hypothetical protein [Blastocatellia bacterium]
MLLFKREPIYCRVNSAFAPEVRDEGSQVQAVVGPRRAWITYGRGSRAPEVREELPVPIDRDLPPGLLFPARLGRAQEHYPCAAVVGCR